MTAVRKRILVVVCLLLPFAARADELGNISFANSGAPEAQDAFLTGVKALHSFQFDEARFAFEEAQRIDPDFALAYWGQAMSDNHPLWAQQDIEAATAALNRLAPTHAARLAKAPTGKEKAYLEAINVLYFSPGDKLTRDIAYAEFMAGMHERWPDDDEIAIFYALSLLGTVRPGDRGFRRQALAASIAQAVFAENPNHPGAAHFIIHSFDDPDHAILALPAARVYADIAPAAAHALHMPSHIFLQLGMWQDVKNSNIDAYAAAVAVNAKYGLAEGREDFHTLSWLAYANLMLGQYEAAAADLQKAAATVDRNPGSDRVLNGYLDMRGRHMIETGEWEAVDLAPVDSAEGRHGNWIAAVGMSAVHRGDQDGAKAAVTRLNALAREAESAGDTYNHWQNTILENQVLALTLLKNGDHDGAASAARNAAELEVQYMRVPSGPPKPMKPASELYADILLAANRPEQAIDAYERALQWVPQRTPSMRGLAAAAAKSGDTATADEMNQRLRSMPGAKLMD
jgi:tetratricopeptide (TPR) repeat protein